MHATTLLNLLKSPLYDSKIMLGNGNELYYNDDYKEWVIFKNGKCFYKENLKDALKKLTKE